MSHGGIRGPVIEPQLQFMQAYVPDQMNTVLQKEEELLKVVQTVAQLLQQQIVLGMHTADMS